jgi:hypothetical protein
MKHIVSVEDNGTMTSLGNPLGLPVVKSERWSHIKPVGPVLRLLFNTVRYCFGDSGRAAAWTRRWPCMWELTVLSTGWTARSNDRSALVAIEHEKYFLSEGLDL